MHRLRFVVPVDVDRPTGGNVYDLRIAGELERRGVLVDLVRASDADLAEVAPGPGFVLIDGLLASTRPDVVRSCRAGVLVHMPLAWRSAAESVREAEAMRAASVVVATSAWTARFLLQEYAVRAAVVRPGTDPAPIAAGSDPPLIVQIATVVPNKNQLQVVQALAGVVDLPWRARLVGSLDVDPAYAAAVRSAVAAAGLEHRIEIAGELPREAAFASADLLLLTSRAEAYGMVVTEALARGIPAIVSPGGPAEALGGTPTGATPGAVLPGAASADNLETTLRTWLSSHEIRSRWRHAAVERRTDLISWASAAQSLHSAITSG